MDTREDRLLELVGSVYESVLDPAMTAMALDRFASFFGGVAAQLYTFDEASGEVVDSQITDTLAAKDNEA